MLFLRSFWGFLGTVVGGVGAMALAVVPYGAALAFIPAAKLLEAASAAMDGSVARRRPQLHPAGFIGVTTFHAAE